MRRLLPNVADVTDVHAEYPVPDLDVSRRWHVRANFVASVDGAVTADGVSAGLSPPADQRVFEALRDLADAVLVGAGTVRIEGYHPSRPSPDRQAARVARGLASAPTFVVVSSRLDLNPADALFTAPDARTAVVTHAAAPADRRAALAEVCEVIVAGERVVDPQAALGALAERGMGRVLCEGGPHLLATLLAAGTLDELCLTLSPLATGPGAARIVDGRHGIDPTPLDLLGLLEEDGTLFLRYGVGGSHLASSG